MLDFDWPKQPPNIRKLKICCMQVRSPSLLEKKEHNYIHGYNTLYPIGLNKINPFGIPRLSVWIFTILILIKFYSYIFSILAKDDYEEFTRNGKMK